MGRASDNLVDVGLVDDGSAVDPLDRFEGDTKEVLAKLLETSTVEGSVEVDNLEESGEYEGQSRDCYFSCA